MTLLRFIYKNFDPDHLIPERGWLAVIALGVQTGLLFVVALLLVKLDSTSTNKTAVFHQKFTETAVLSNEFDNLYKHIKLYEQSVGNYINTGDSLALAVTQNEQLLVEESLAILGNLVDESGKTGADGITTSHRQCFFREYYRPKNPATGGAETSADQAGRNDNGR